MKSYAKGDHGHSHIQPAVVVADVDKIDFGHKAVG